MSCGPTWQRGESCSGYGRALGPLLLHCRLLLTQAQSLDTGAVSRYNSPDRHREHGLPDVPLRPLHACCRCSLPALGRANDAEVLAELAAVLDLEVHLDLDTGGLRRWQKAAAVAAVRLAHDAGALPRARILHMQ